MHGLQRLQNFTLYHCQDIRVARVEKGSKIPDFIIFRISRLRGLQRLQSFRLYHFQDIKVAKVAKFQTISL